MFQACEWKLETDVYSRIFPWCIIAWNRDLVCFSVFSSIAIIVILKKSEKKDLCSLVD
jgi:hypothetical protein